MGLFDTVSRFMGRQKEIDAMGSEDKRKQIVPTPMDGEQDVHPDLVVRGRQNPEDMKKAMADHLDSSRRSLKSDIFTDALRTHFDAVKSGNSNALVQKALKGMEVDAKESIYAMSPKDIELFAKRVAGDTLRKDRENDAAQAEALHDATSRALDKAA